MHLSQWRTTTHFRFSVSFWQSANQPRRRWCIDGVSFSFYHGQSLLYWVPCGCTRQRALLLLRRPAWRHPHHPHHPHHREWIPVCLVLRLQIQTNLHRRNRCRTLLSRTEPWPRLDLRCGKDGQCSCILLPRCGAGGGGGGDLLRVVVALLWRRRLECGLGRAKEQVGVPWYHRRRTGRLLWAENCRGRERDVFSNHDAAVVVVVVVVGVGVAVFWQTGDGVDARCCTECRWLKNVQHWTVVCVKRGQNYPVTAGGEVDARRPLRDLHL